MAEHGVSLVLTEDAKELLVEQGYDPTMGARPLRRAIQRLIEDPLADEVLAKSYGEGTTLIVDRDDDRMKLVRGEGEPEKVGAAAGAGEEPAAETDAS
jgi:ATP-dependent Clp protease ATP-binding subunit ClpC